MKPPAFTVNALGVMVAISELGVSVIAQQKIGTFAVAFGLFEAHLEPAVWALKRESVKGVRPSTDGPPASQLVTIVGNGREDLSPGANEVLARAAEAAHKLMHYRHSLLHGYLVPLGETAFFMRNPRWNGEERKRPFGDASIEDYILDMAADVAWVLVRIIAVLRKINDDAETETKLESFASDLTRIKPYLGEVARTYRTT
ncbi:MULTISPECIES: hypothetical protein [unclassified Pseudomonas]|uniref:hypothetical protein n=1 Tax=unclassified Pseudomonas TaxID=196821 RepID=UPI000C87F8CE|nr:MULTISPECIES: hypothetical protein [unclassified Pseudomonas]PMZ97135.1 hypothetical protein C1X28_29025 [Pseudomonas sp. FW305-BF15]PNB77329.1 hypothetical protein C1X30_29000 [Pseudomonas sp. FW305-BF6]